MTTAWAVRRPLGAGGAPSLGWRSSCRPGSSRGGRVGAVPVYASSADRPALQFTTRVAESSADLRASASLRAMAFYTYPEDRSEFALASHRRMNADLEWDMLEKKTKGEDKDWEEIGVTCMLASTQLGCENPVVAAALEQMDKSCMLPSTTGGAASIVVGTLDVNRGGHVPGEVLEGARPEGGSPSERGYISNVCTAPAARRCGVARQLVEDACDLARSQGVRDVYVHVVHTNTSAMTLYLSCGFQLEAEETEQAAKQLERPRRVLLHLAL